MTTSTIRIGTRGSALAMAQARQVAERLVAELGRQVELVPVTTVGDRDRGALADIGGQGIFVGALREALLRGEVDIAVHSLKDLPTDEDPRVVVAAVPTRADPRDALVARDGLTLGELPPGATVGTGSLRRAAQLRALGFDLDVVPIRGNVDTRVRMVADGIVDAVVLARAGLVRLGRADVITETLDPLQMLPAPGQGALAVEVAASAGSFAVELGSVLDDAEARATVTAERTVLRALEAGCTAPVGALADLGVGDDGSELWLRAAVLAVDGSAAVRLSTTGPPDRAEELGLRLARDLLADGAADLVQESVA